MRSNNVVVLRETVDALVAEPIQDRCVTELQALIAGIAPQLERLAGLSSLALGQLQAMSGGTVPPVPVPVPVPAPGEHEPPVSEPPLGPSVLVRHWLRDTLGESSSVAGRLVRLATELRELPVVAQSVADGVLLMSHAAVLARLVGPIEPAALADVEPLLVEVAQGCDPQQLACWVRHLIATWCEPELEANAKDQEGRRSWISRRDNDGMISGSFRFTAEDSETILPGLEAMARRSDLADTRTISQRRADAAVELFAAALRFADLPDCGGFRPQISYVLPAAWAASADRPAGSLADLIDASLPTRNDHTTGAVGAADAAQEPAENIFGARYAAAMPVDLACATGAWSGPQTRARIETVLCEARITRVLLDPTGQVHKLETLTDAITKNQRRALLARDGGCVARGCTRPPAFCDAHHLDHREDGGETDLHNLVLLCRYHHLRWHQGKLGLHQLHVPWHHEQPNTASVSTPPLTPAGILFDEPVPT